jgi:hypothetical protein
MAQFLKSQSPDELWKAALKPKDALKPDNPAKANSLDPSSASKPLQPGKTPGTGLTLDVTA